MEKYDEAIFKKRYDKKNIVATNLHLPLFLLSRLSLQKSLRPGYVQKYLRNHDKFYAKDCRIEKEYEQTTIKRCKHLAGLEPPNKSYCSDVNFSRTKRFTEYDKLIVTPPTTNDFHEPYDCKKGIGGAYWPKVHTNTAWAKKKQIKEVWKFYDVNNTELANYTGNMGLDLRDELQGSRLYNDTLPAYRRKPSEPGPSAYYPRLHEISTRVTKPKTTTYVHPHKFLKSSIVPAMFFSHQLRNTAYTPGPERYNTRYTNTCPCSRGNKIYLPEIDDIIFFEERKKFRNEPYKRYKRKYYCTPKWSHVKGHGHTYLFKNKKQIDQFKAKVKVKPDNLQLKMFADARYMNLIKNPTRIARFSFSKRKTLPIKFFYNCTARRKQIRVVTENRRVAFGNSERRFSMKVDRLANVRRELLERIRRGAQKLKMRSHSLKIKLMEKERRKTSRYKQIPERLLPTFKPELRRKLFKFSPLPEPKVLVTDADVHGPRKDGVVKYKSLYTEEIDINDFLKKGTIIPEHFKNKQRYGSFLWRKSIAF